MPEQPKSLLRKEQELLPLHQNEIDLILMIRHEYRFGKIEIDCRDGLPQDILKTIQRTRLGTDLSTR